MCTWKSLNTILTDFDTIKGFCPFRKPSTLCSWCNPFSFHLVPSYSHFWWKWELTFYCCALYGVSQQFHNLTLPRSPSMALLSFSSVLQVTCPFLPSSLPLALSILLGYFILFSHRYASLTDIAWLAVIPDGYSSVYPVLYDRFSELLSPQNWQLVMCFPSSSA